MKLFGPRHVMLCLLLTVAQVIIQPKVYANDSGYVVGADVSFLGSAEKQGIRYSDAGVEKPVLQIFKDHGYNWVRLRVFVRPDKLPNDLPYTIALAKEAKKFGYHFLLDFHYSDTWADPQKQFMPVDWQNLDHSQLTEKIFTYTRDTLIAFRDAGVYPDMVQPGNEITHGMLWPDGKLPEHWDQFADLLKSAIQGIDASRGKNPRPQILIQIERSGDPIAAVAYVEKLNTYRLAWDCLGLSYYPHYHGNIHGLHQTLHDLARYNKPLYVVETGYPWKEAGHYTGAEEFPRTPEGQKQFLDTVNAEVQGTPNGLGRGVFWWEPVTPGRGGSQNFFDDQHEALPVLTDNGPAQRSKKQ